MFEALLEDVREKWTYGSSQVLNMNTKDIYIAATLGVVLVNYLDIDTDHNCFSGVKLTWDSM